MLAVVVAIASISTTPGLVSAGKKCTNQIEEQKDSKRGRRKKRKRMKKSASGIDKKKTEDIYSEIKNDLLPMEDLGGLKKFDNLKKDRNIFTRSRAKKIDSSSDQSGSEMDLKNIVSTMDILLKCAKDTKAVENVSNSILSLAENGFFKSKPKEELLKAINALKICVDNDLAKEKAVCAVEILINGGYFAGWNKDEILSILEVLTKCAERGDLAPKITQVVRLLDETLNLLSFGNAAVREFIQSPMRFSKKREAANVVTTAVAISLPTISVRNKKLSNMPREVDNNNVIENANYNGDVKMEDGDKNDDANIVMKDAKNDDDDKKTKAAPKKYYNVTIVARILGLQKSGEFKEMSRKQIWTIAKSFMTFLNSEAKTARQKVEAIIKLAKEKCFEQWESKQLERICGALIKFADEDANLKPMVVDAVLKLGEKGQFVHSSAEKIFEILLDVLLKSCEKYDVKSALSSIIDFIEIRKGRINSNKKVLNGEQIKKVLELIKKGLSNQDSKESASYLFACFLGKRLFRIKSVEFEEGVLRVKGDDELSDSLKEFLQIKNEVFSFIKTKATSSADFDKKNFVFIIETMIDQGVLSDEEIGTAIEILEKCFEDESARESAWRTVRSLFCHKFLSKEAFFKIVSIWEKYNEFLLPKFDTDEYRFEIFYEIERFLESDKYYSLNDEDIIRIVKYLSKIFKRSCRRNLKEGIYIYEYIYVFHTIFKLCNNKQMYDLFKVEFLETLEFLKGYSSVKGFKNIVLELVKLPSLAQRDILAEWKKEELEKMLDMLKMCKEGVPSDRLQESLYLNIDTFSQVISNYIAKAENLTTANKPFAERHKFIFTTSNVPLTQKINKDEIITKTLESLSKRLKQGNADANILDSALKLFKDHYDKNTSKEKIVDLLEIFRQCLQITGYDGRVLGVISRLVSDDYFSGWSKEDGLLKVTDLLFECSKNKADLFNIRKITVDMVCKGYLDKFSNEERSKIFSLFKPDSQEDSLQILGLIRAISNDNVCKIMEYIRKST